MVYKCFHLHVFLSYTENFFVCLLAISVFFFLRQHFFSSKFLLFIQIWMSFWVRKLSEWASLMAQMVKNLPAVQETQVWSLGWEGPLEKGMATHSSILAWRIPWAVNPGGLQSMGLQRVRHDWATDTRFFKSFTHFLSFWLFIFGC